MPKASAALVTLPPVALASLAHLGEHLAIARIRRKQSQRTWAARLGVSVPTVVRMEQGDARVSMGVYATALWMMGRAQALGELALPEHDRGALEQDVRAAVRKREARRAKARTP